MMSEEYSLYPRVFHCEDSAHMGIKLFSTHKYKIPSCGISQIDGLQAGKITYEDSSLLVVRKFVKPTFAHQIRW